MSATGSLLEVSGLILRFGNGRGLHGVDLTAPRNSITGFIGVNGAGKSTTLRCILGLLKPEAGSVRLFGRAADAAARRRLGFLPEERGLFAGDRARDVIAFNARLRGVSKREAYRRADSLLDRIGLGGREREPIGSLSKGNAQRVQLLCALGHSPDMLILDEPLSGLDPMAQSEVLALFAEFRSNGGAILFSTHTMAAAESVCDRVVILSNGRTAFEGPVAEAARQAPYGAVIVTDDEAGLRQAVAAVGGQVRPLSDPGARFGSAARWEITLPRDVPHPALIRALSEAAVALHAFEPIRSDLQGAFLTLARAEEAGTPPAVARRAA